MCVSIQGNKTYNAHTIFFISHLLQVSIYGNSPPSYLRMQGRQDIFHRTGMNCVYSKNSNPTAHLTFPQLLNDDILIITCRLDPANLVLCQSIQTYFFLLLLFFVRTGLCNAILTSFQFLCGSNSHLLYWHLCSKITG